MTACNRHGCTGTLDEAGYCQVCLERPGEDGQPGIPAAQTEQPDQPDSGRPDGLLAGRHPRPDWVPGGATADRGVIGASRRASGDPWWGLDLVTLPEIPVADPERALQPNPSVPRSLRACGHCSARVGQTHDGQAALATGFCLQCGMPYSFIPKLQRDTMVAGRYKVSGCIGYGGLGWVFIADDTNLNGQPVVLKGLIDPGNQRVADAAERELRFLTEVDHPNIVRVRDFVKQPANGPASDEYIVMEYIPGHTVDQVAARDSGMSAEHVIAYCLHLLAAVEHLHERDWLHCDVKPSNLMLAGTGVKLIDLGAGCRSAPAGIPGEPRATARRRSRGPGGPRCAVTCSLWPDDGDHVQLDRGISRRPARHGEPPSASPPSPAIESLNNFIARATADGQDARFGPQPRWPSSSAVCSGSSWR